MYEPGNFVRTSATSVTADIARNSSSELHGRAAGFEHFTRERLLPGLLACVGWSAGREDRHEGAGDQSGRPLRAARG
jgi:hypothetical protein